MVSKIFTLYIIFCVHLFVGTDYLPRIKLHRNLGEQVL